MSNELKAFNKVIKHTALKSALDTIKASGKIKVWPRDGSQAFWIYNEKDYVAFYIKETAKDIMYKHYNLLKKLRD